MPISTPSQCPQACALTLHRGPPFPPVAGSNSPVELWLLMIEQQMRETLRILLRNALPLLKAGRPDKAFKDVCGQHLINGSLVTWTLDNTKALDEIASGHEHRTNWLHNFYFGGEHGVPHSIARAGGLKKLVGVIGKQRLVLDLSCRRTAEGWVVAMNRWQTLTDLAVTEETLDALAGSCAGRNLPPEPDSYVAADAIGAERAAELALDVTPTLPVLVYTEAEVRKAAENGHRWRNPDWTHHDGSLAEW
mgnify:CR=1 FL=1